MSTVEEIQDAVQKLTIKERDELRLWFKSFEDDNWERQMAEDVAAGRLDHLAKEADEDFEEGRCKPL